jgi:hypothetical protein
MVSFALYNLLLASPIIQTRARSAIQPASKEEKVESSKKNGKSGTL